MDLNSDGIPDLAVSSKFNDSDSVSILRGNGDGTFQLAVNYAAGSSPYSVALGDLDGDGRPDLAVANATNTNTITTLMNTVDLPVWSATYPQQSTTSNSSIEVLVNADSDGSAYLVCLPGGAAAPTATQVRSGQDAVGVPLAGGLTNSVALVAGSTETLACSALSPSTSYELYTVTADSEGSLQAWPTKLTVTTDSLHYNVGAAVVGGNGTLICNSPVTPGSTSLCTAAPAGGYQLATISGCGNGTLDVNQYTTEAIYSDCTVTATFAEALPPQGSVVDFNSGTLPSGWNLPGDIPWVFDSNDYHSAGYSLRSGAISDWGWAAAEIPLKTVGSGQVTFWLRTNSQPGDALRFFIDGNLVGIWDGFNDWTQVSFPVSAGTHSFGWSYQKNASGASGADAVWIDDVVFPAAGGGTAPDCPVLLYDNLDSYISEKSPSQNLTGTLVWSESWYDEGNAIDMFRIMSLVDGVPTILDSSSGLFNALKMPNINNDGDVVWVRHEGPEGTPMIHGIVNGLPLTPFPGFSPAINDLDEIVYIDGSLNLSSSTRGMLVSGVTKPREPDINDNGDVVWVEGTATWTGNGYDGSWLLQRLNNTQGAMPETVTTSTTTALPSPDSNMSSPTISDAGEVVWGENGALISDRRGPITLGCASALTAWVADFVGNDRLVFIGNDPSSNSAIYQIDLSLIGCTDDQDCDGMPDSWEMARGLNQNDPADALSDLDADNLTNLAEFTAGTDPHLFDTDGDGLNDNIDPNPLVAQLAAPTDFVVPATSTTGNFTLAWTLPAEATGVEIEESTDGSFTGAATYTLAAVTSLDVTGNPTGTYSYRVRAVADPYQTSDWTSAGPCVVVIPSAIVSPANNSELSGASQLFTWENTGASLYQLYVGTTAPGSYNVGLFPSPATTGTSTTVTGLPTNNSTVYVRLYSKFGTTWYYNDYTFTASSVAVPAAMVNPAAASTLQGKNVLFTWTASGAELYQLHVGTTGPGSEDVGLFPASASPATSTTVTGLPTDGRTIYVRLSSKIGADWFYNDYTYTAVTIATMISHADGSALGGTSQTFIWDDSGASLYQLYVGTTAPGAYDVGLFPNPPTAEASVTVSDLPNDGRTVYVRLYSKVGSTWLYNDYSYMSTAPSTMVSPANGATFDASSQSFSWNNSGASLYQLYVGTTAPGSTNVGVFPSTPATETTTTVTKLPTDGRTVYVRLYSKFGTKWSYSDYTYTALTISTMVSPLDGATLTGTAHDFVWADTGAESYQLYVGSAGPGSTNIGVFPGTPTTVTSVTATGLPNDGRTVYVRLRSKVGGTWCYNDYTYTAFTAVPSMMLAPTDQTTLSGASQLFSWIPTGATSYQLYVGTTAPGSFNLGLFPATPTGASSTTVTGLPTDGRTVYVRLYSKIGLGWQYRDYTYTAFTIAPATMVTPAVNLSTLSGTSQLFTWTNTGAEKYHVYVGTTKPGSYDIGMFPAVPTTTETSTVVIGLPTDGRIVYVRLRMS